MMRFSAKRHPGFTLIELVVAAMVGMLVIAGLYIAQRKTERRALS